MTGDPDQELARFCNEVRAGAWSAMKGSAIFLRSRLRDAPALRHGPSRVGQAAARTIVKPHGPELSPGFLLQARLFMSIAGSTGRVSARSPSWVPWVRACRVAARELGRSCALNVCPARRALRRRNDPSIAAPSASSLALHRPRHLHPRGAWSSAQLWCSRPGAGRMRRAYERIKCDVPNIVNAGVLPVPTGTWGPTSHRELVSLSAYPSMLQPRKDGRSAAVARGVCPDESDLRAHGRSRVSPVNRPVCSGGFAGLPLSPRSGDSRNAGIAATALRGTDRTPC